jgi:hypothetical protein
MGCGYSGSGGAGLDQTKGNLRFRSPLLNQAVQGCRPAPIIRLKEDVLEGIERMPKAFLRLLHGKNFGNQIVRIS